MGLMPGSLGMLVDVEPIGEAGPGLACDVCESLPPGGGEGFLAHVVYQVRLRSVRRGGEREAFEGRLCASCLQEWVLMRLEGA